MVCWLDGWMVAWLLGGWFGWVFVCLFVWCLFVCLVFVWCLVGGCLVGAAETAAPPMRAAWIWQDAISSYGWRTESDWVVDGI